MEARDGVWVLERFGPRRGLIGCFTTEQAARRRLAAVQTCATQEDQFLVTLLPLWDGTEAIDACGKVIYINRPTGLLDQIEAAAEEAANRPKHLQRDVRRPVERPAAEE